MKKALLFIVCCLGLVGGRAQNLVPNPGFEDYYSCPLALGQLWNTFSWYNPTDLSPDYYNSCDHSLNGPSVPSNLFGIQTAHSGDGYAGIFASERNAAPDVREYIRVQLNMPLQSGVTYFIQFYCSLGDRCTYGVKELGAYLSSTDSTTMQGYIMAVTPQITSYDSLFDKINWIQVKGTYVAAGNEKYLTIGNFYNDSLSGVPSTTGESYYYIDDVCVSTDSFSCNSVTNISSIPNSSFTLSPNPATDQLNISIDESLPAGQASLVGSTLNIYNINGALVQTAVLQIQNSKLQIQNLPSGVYIAEVKTKDGSVKKRWVKM